MYLPDLNLDTTTIYGLENDLIGFILNISTLSNKKHSWKSNTLIFKEIDVI